MKKLLKVSTLFCLAIALSAFMLAPQSNKGGKFLKKGEKAPNFVTEDVFGNKVKLNKLLKEQKVLLTFLRPAWCPICNARTHQLIENYQQLKDKGIEIVVIYPTKKEIMLDYVSDMKIPFIVIADPEEKLYKTYNIERSGEKGKATMSNEAAMADAKKGMELFGDKAKKYGEMEQVPDPIIPADFIIDQKKNIEVAHYGTYIGDHVSIKAIETYLIGRNNPSEKPKGDTPSGVRF